MHAIVHTKGVVLDQTYIPLELAYKDATGLLQHFLITSPMSFSQMRKINPHCRPDVLVTMNDGTSYPDTLKFLKSRFDFLQKSYPGSPVIFGYKGNFFQPNILYDAGIPVGNTVNVEKFGVPPLKRKRNIMTGPTTNGASFCHLHKGRSDKCALTALNEILNHFHQ